jgi:hypothetical protein
MEISRAGHEGSLAGDFADYQPFQKNFLRDTLRSSRDKNYSFKFAPGK